MPKTFAKMGSVDSLHEIFKTFSILNQNVKKVM